ncbi:hypothetical protein ACTD5D_30890 [Nocardia takedensis]|uniref:hypothetical protein n=1 Tax=Nocardia takedensis TaxID=259390 RepID=UPI003F75D8BE
MSNLWENYNAPISNAFDRAKSAGWAEIDISIDRLLSRCDTLGFEAVPPRRDLDPVTVLKPRKRSDSPRRSLSAKYGTGKFPLHTDGAAMERPPEFIVLQATSESDIPTFLLSLKTLRLFDHLGDALRHGMFLIENGQNSFYSSVLSDGYFRYDPGCMLPADDLADTVASYFASLDAAAEEHIWADTTKSLVIHNHSAVHGRSTADGATGRELKRLMLRSVEE